MKENEDPVYRFLSLAAKAGRIKSGAFLTEEAVRKGRAVLVLVAVDAAENTRKKIIPLCEGRKVPWALFGEKERLGRCTGKEERSVLAVTDPSFGDKIKDMVRNETEVGNP